jgi:hypothetical protein
MQIQFLTESPAALQVAEKMGTGWNRTMGSAGAEEAAGKLGILAKVGEELPPRPKPASIQRALRGGCPPASLRLEFLRSL